MDQIRRLFRRSLHLPRLPTHHRDPFDRLLVAQAMVEPMRLITHDGVVARYGAFVLKV